MIVRTKIAEDNLISMLAHWVNWAINQKSRLAHWHLYCELRNWKRSLFGRATNQLRTADKMTKSHSYMVRDE